MSFSVSAQSRRDAARMHLTEAALGKREDARLAEARCRPTQRVAVAIAKPDQYRHEATAIVIVGDIRPLLRHRRVLPRLAQRG